VIFQRSKRQYFICHGTTSIPAHVIQAATGADVVYHKDYEHGVLYGLYFTAKHCKQNSTVENAIMRLDGILMAKNGTSKTSFTSLTEIGKVKSFGGRDRHDDYHFREIFNVNLPKLDDGKKYQLQAGVVAWSPGAAVSAASGDGFDELVLKLKSTAAVDENTKVVTEVEELEAELDEKEEQIEDSKLKIAQLLAEKEKNTNVLNAQVSLNDICLVCFVLTAKLPGARDSGAQSCCCFKQAGKRSQDRSSDGGKCWIGCGEAGKSR